MSERPPNVKVGDRVQITTVHTGTITEIDDTGFLLDEIHGGGRYWSRPWAVQR